MASRSLLRRARTWVDTNRPIKLSWQQGTGDTVKSTPTRRRMSYTVASLRYLWYESTWLAAARSVIR
jgi:hypothetical protein